MLKFVLRLLAGHPTFNPKLKRLLFKHRLIGYSQGQAHAYQNTNEAYANGYLYGYWAAKKGFPLERSKVRQGTLALPENPVVAMHWHCETPQKVTEQTIQEIETFLRRQARRG